MSVDRLPCRMPAAMTRVGDHWVLVPDGDAEVALINETGRAIVEQCDGTRTVEDIARKIAATGVAYDTALADVTAFLDGLYRAGLLKHDHSADTA
ncbi:PqqD family protein [Saccharopolyspora pogona]|uniref:PqqD family protein n=1 Tax=Saccharopolyspora pogona TaxID=333966 RepID=UPI0016841199|nr:PqqD family protein [Saccharopolyspora pogona]